MAVDVLVDLRSCLVDGLLSTATNPARALKYRYTAKRRSRWGYAGASAWGGVTGAAGAAGKLFTTRWIDNAFKRPRPLQTYWPRAAVHNLRRGWIRWRVILNRNPEAAWYGLTWQQRRQALKAAGKNRKHPDPEVAQIAYRWAEWRLRPSNERRETSAKHGLLVILSDAATGGVIGNLAAERRAARKILKMYR